VSLRSQLREKDSPVTRFFKELIPSVRSIAPEYNARMRGLSTIRPPAALGNPPWGIIGTAIDFRLRYYFGVTPTYDLAAAQGARMLYTPPGHTAPPGRAAWGGEALLVSDRTNVAKIIPALAMEFFLDLEQALHDLRPVGQRLSNAGEERLCRYCFVLALLEQPFRVGTGIDSPLYKLRRGATSAHLLALAGQGWVEDMCQLSWMFYDRQAGLLTQPTILNPTFAGSGDIGGADADLIVDGCLIDIKATVNTKLDPEWLYQLLGYVLLDYEDAHRIRSIGLYFARQGELIQWPLDAFLAAMVAAPVTLPELRDRFKTLLTAQNTKWQHPRERRGERSGA
jgi:hypothetical protein